MKHLIESLAAFSFICLVTLAHAGTHTVQTPIFSLDTRGVGLGSVTGRVVSAGLPIAGAKIAIEGTEHSALSSASGSFVIPGIPAGNGYKLTAASANQLTASLPNINVPVGILSVGEVLLQAASKPYKLIPIAPDINSSLTEVEETGTAYRYYLVVDANSLPVGNVPFSLKIAGGPEIPQGEVGEEYAGRTTGLSDPDGILRVSLPGSYLSKGSQRTVDVWGDGEIKASFRAILRNRQYERVWKHKFGGGVSGKIKVVRVGGKAAFESEIVHVMRNDFPISERITRKRAGEIRAGYELSLPCKVASVGVGGFLGGDFQTTYAFDPYEDDRYVNALKLCLALGDFMIIGPGPYFNFYTSAMDYESQIQDRLVSSGVDFRLGAYGEAIIGLKPGREKKLIGPSISGSFTASGQREFIMGVEERYGGMGDNISAGSRTESIYSFGFAASSSRDLSIGEKKSKGPEFNFSLISVNHDIQYRARIWRYDESLWPRRVQLSQKTSNDNKNPLALSWVEPMDEYMEVSEELSLELPTLSSYARLKDLAPAWQGLNNPDDARNKLKNVELQSFPLSMLAYARDNSSMISYSRKIYAADVGELDGGLSLDALVAGLGLQVIGRVEKGAEAIKESGYIVRDRRMPTVMYPQVDTYMFPDISVTELESYWAAYASSPILDWVEENAPFVIVVGENVINAGNAVLEFRDGALELGSVVISRFADWVAGPFQGPQLQIRSSHTISAETLPSAGASNYFYGIGGVYIFSSTNDFLGTASLTIAYDQEQVTGLNESELRIYRASTNNLWTLVGGSVDVVSNTVSCTVTQLGTYTIAPPLPAGMITFNLSTNILMADGTSVVVAVASNLLLNTGTQATQSWWFTASALGVSILNTDADTNLPGTQFASSNGVLTITLQAPADGQIASLDVISHAGSASGSIGIPVVDEIPPPAPTGIVANAGQSRIWLSWPTNSPGALHRVYYRAGQAGPPYDGTCRIDGVPSPVTIQEYSVVLRGLDRGTNYYLAVSAIDATGNEGPLTPIGPVSTAEVPPHPPTGVAVSFGIDGTNTLMWGLSEDDGYNDRDVIRYEIFRAVMPGGTPAKIAEVPAGTALYREPTVPVDDAQFIVYSVVAIDSGASSSQWMQADNLLPDGMGADNDWDGIADAWEEAYGLNPSNRLDGAMDDDDDGFTNLEEFLADTNPANRSSRLELNAVRTTNGNVRLEWQSGVLAKQELWATESLLNPNAWQLLRVLEPPTETSNTFTDAQSTITSRIYRINTRR